MKNVKIIGALGIFLAVYLWYLYQAPYIAIKKITEAVASKDSKRLSEYIDFPKVQESIRPQAYKIAASMASRLVPQGNDVFSSFARGIGESKAYQQADEMIFENISPEGLEKVLNGQLPLNPSFAFVQNQDAVRRTVEQATFKRTGLSTMLVTMQPNLSVNDLITLTLSRTGFTWKLTDVQIPVQSIIVAMNPPVQRYPSRYPQQYDVRARPRNEGFNRGYGLRR